MSYTTTLYFISRFDDIKNFLGFVIFAMLCYIFYSLVTDRYGDLFKIKKPFFGGLIFSVILYILLPTTQEAVFILTYGSDMDSGNMGQYSYEWLNNGFKKSQN